MQIKIDIRGLDALRQRFSTIGPVIEREMRHAMRKSVDVVEEAVVGRTPVNTGALRASISGRVEGSKMALRGIVGTAILYGAPVEFGRKAGKMPPVEAIEAWVIRKRIATGADARSAAFVIARAIGRRGTKGVHMFEKGMKDSEGKVISIWESLPGKIVGHLGE